VTDRQTTMMDVALDEVFHGGPSPELAERVLATLSGRVPAREAQSSKAQPGRRAPASRARRWTLRALESAVVLGVVAVVAFLVLSWRDDVTQELKAPEGVSVTADAKFSVLEEDDLGMRGQPAVVIEDGWYVSKTNAPAVIYREQRVEMVEGIAVIKVGALPTAAEIAARLDWLKQFEVEGEMLNGNWLRIGGLSILMLAGSALVDGNTVYAQDGKGKAEAGPRHDKIEELKKEIRELERKLERIAENEGRPGAAEKRAELEKKLEEKRQALREHQAKKDEHKKDPHPDKEGRRPGGEGDQKKEKKAK